MGENHLSFLHHSNPDLTFQSDHLLASTIEINQSFGNSHERDKFHSRHCYRPDHCGQRLLVPNRRQRDAGTDGQIRQQAVHVEPHQLIVFIWRSAKTMNLLPSVVTVPRAIH